MVFKIGNLDITPYIAYQGLKYTRNDVDGSNAGRTLSGLLIRDRVAIKDKWTVTCRPLTTAEMVVIMSAIEPEFITCTYTSPRTGTQVTKTMYSNNVPAQYLMLKEDGTEYWAGISFPLVEK